MSTDNQDVVILKFTIAFWSQEKLDDPKSLAANFLWSKFVFEFWASK